jgi:UDP-2-acetamido-3-amino-2,3-dideoxy-glucuronate N-acetyltransferase
MRTPVSVAVVGLGRRGATLARTFEELPRAELRWLCDQRPGAGIRGTAAVLTVDIDDVLGDETLDAVAIATPPATRAQLVRRALEADKHVYVEGPVATVAAEAQQLFQLAADRGRRLLPGHPLLFHPAMRKLKELIELGRLGDLYYLSAVLQTQGRSAGDGGVLTGLAAAAVSAILYLAGDEPVGASSFVESYQQPGTAEFACAYLRFATGVGATLQLSWLDAREQCRLVAVGSWRTAVFDDAKSEPKLTIHERATRGGAEIVCPRIAAGDPVRLQCDAFLAGIRSAVEFPGAKLEPAVARVLEQLGREPGAAEPAPPLEPHRHLRLAATE